MRQTALTPDRALEIARQAEPNATPIALFLPTQQSGEGSHLREATRAPEANRGEGARNVQGSRGAQGGGHPAGSGPSWRVQLSRVDSGQTVTVNG